MTKKIEFAPAVDVEEYREEVDVILRHLAILFKEPEESVDDWLQYCFVSDESRLANFLGDDSELEMIQRRLGMPELVMRDSLCAIAATLRRRIPKASLPQLIN